MFRRREKSWLDEELERELYEMRVEQGQTGGMPDSN